MDGLVRLGPVLAYVVLVLAVVYSLWLNYDAMQRIEDTSRAVSIENCESLNNTRVALLAAVEDTLLPPRPVPEGASSDLQEFIEASEERSATLLERLEQDVGPIDCEQRYQEASEEARSGSDPVHADAEGE